MGRPRGQECLGLCEIENNTGGLKIEEMLAWFGIVGITPADVKNMKNRVCIGCAKSFLPEEFRKYTAKELEVRKGVVRS